MLLEQYIVDIRNQNKESKPLWLRIWVFEIDSLWHLHIGPRLSNILIAIDRHAMNTKIPILPEGDANVHHTAWSSNDIDARADNLIQFLIISDQFNF